MSVATMSPEKTTIKRIQALKGKHYINLDNARNYLLRNYLCSPLSTIYYIKNENT